VPTEAWEKAIWKGNAVFRQLKENQGGGSLKTETTHHQITCHLSLKMNIHPFVEAVASLQFEDCFNPYSDRL